MARKTTTTKRQVIILSAKPLDDDEADYLVSRERGLTHNGTSFEEFLKQRPRDVKKLKGSATAPARWKGQLLNGAAKECEGLRDAVRVSAIGVLRELAQDPFPKGALPVAGHRGHYRAPFYRDQYRMIYKVTRSQKAVVVTRIRRKDEKTYAGVEQTLPAAN